MNDLLTQNPRDAHTDAVRAQALSAASRIGSDGAVRPQHFVTDGEKKFDRTTYNRIGYIANALLSVISVYWVERTHGGQKMMQSFGAWAGRTLRVNPHTAEHLGTKSFFLSGGFAVLLPMKWMEDRKVQLIRAWNEKIYGDRLDTDPVLVQSQRELERAPKQTWASIFSSRALALIPFYVTVGLLWNQNSILSRMTGAPLRNLSKDAMKTLAHENPSAFSQMASKGIYFDRPIAAASRAIGKVWARLSGNSEALARLGEMETKYPGMIKQGPVGSHERDTLHSTLPYYFISEAITSGIVAWGVYALTRVMAVIFHNKPHVPQDTKVESQPPIAADRAPDAVAPVDVARAVPGTQVLAAHTHHLARQSTEQAARAAAR